MNDLHNDPMHQDSETETDELVETIQNGVEKLNMILIVFDDEGVIRVKRHPISPLSFREIKKQLFIEWGIPLHNQELRVGNEILQDDDLLTDFFSRFSTDLIVLNIVNPPVERNPISSFRSDQYLSTTSPQETTTFYDSDEEYDLDDQSRPSKGLVGLKNQGATCYLNSLLQLFYLTPEFRRMIYKFPLSYEEYLGSQNDPSGKNDPQNNIILQMQLLFAKMQFAKIKSVSTSGLTNSFGWTNSEIFIQHDVQELNRVLCDRLEEKMKEKLKETDDSIASLYKGIMLNMIECTKCKNVSSREEDFYDISLVIKGKKDIMESLNQFTEIEKLSDKNAYFCEKCQSKQTADKSIKFKTVPKYLNFQLKRFEYDWHRGVRIKLNNEIEFPLVLDMSPYISTKDIPEENKDLSYEYELMAVLVHSGNASFGHYYAFIKYFMDGNWYKFNDEYVHQVDESDVKNQNWYGEKSSWGSIKSANPYMLIYRRMVPHVVTNIGDKIPGNGLSSTEMPMKKRLLDTQVPPISDEEIPPPLYEYLKEESARKEQKKRELEKQRNLLTISLFRNKLELPQKVIKIDRRSTWKEFHELVLDSIKDESPNKQYIRFRRIANRKNHTRRPMELIKENENKALEYTNLVQKPYLYLEQSESEDFDGLKDIQENHILVSIRFWNKELSRPSTVGDFVLDRTTTLGALKQLVANKIPYPIDETIAVEEETHKVVSPMPDDSKTLGDYSLISGDILHIEPLSPQHKEPKFSFTQKYYEEKLSEIEIPVIEGPITFSRRTSPSNTTNQIIDVDMDAETKTNIRNTFKIHCSQKDSLATIKKLISFKLKVPPNYLRLFIRDHSSTKLLNDTNELLEKITSGNSFIYEILDQPECLQKGDLVLPVKVFDSSQKYVQSFEIKMKKTQIIRELKNVIREKTQIPEDNQILSLWEPSEFHTIIQSDTELLQTIDSHYTLRVDELKDSSMNPIRPDIKVYQVVRYKDWNEINGAKLMVYTDPFLFLVHKNTTIYDLRMKLAECVNINYYNLNFAVNESFPISQLALKGVTKCIQEYCKERGEEPLFPDESDPDAEANILAKSQNRKGEVFFFKSEKILTIEIFKGSIISYEDLREKIPEAKKKRDSASLKIY